MCSSDLDQAAAQGEAEAARRVLVPPDAPAARPRPFTARPRPFTARRRLNRLGRALRRQGWMAERRYGESSSLLRVYTPDMPDVGDSITVVGGVGGWWYQSSTGALLAPCARVDLAVWEVTALLASVGLGGDLVRENG